MKKLRITFIAIGFSIGSIFTLIADIQTQGFSNFLQRFKPDMIKTTVVIYDTLPNQGILNRDKYKLPEPYKLFYDSVGKGYVASYHFNDLGEDMYLKAILPNFVNVFFGISYADHFAKPGQAVALIKEHWREVLADRATHK